MARRNRSIPVIGLAFLDAMTCGLGAVILFYLIIQANVDLRRDVQSLDLQAEVDRREVEVMESRRRLVELRNATSRTEEDETVTRGLSRRLIETLEEIERELATFEHDTLAQRQHLEKLQTDLRSREEEAKRLAASTPSDETPGEDIRVFAGEGDRQYLTGLKVGGERILILLDASASMLDRTVVNVVRRRNLPPGERRKARKWRQAVATVDWITTQFPRNGRFQIYLFDQSVEAAAPGTEETWLETADRPTLERAVAGVRQTVPGGGTSLERAFEALRALDPAPDNVILLTDGLPTQGPRKPRSQTVSGRERLRLFRRATERLPGGVPINVILFPMEGDPMAPTAFWKLALATRGSFLTPSEDWP